jgi:hypothetical protein
MKVKDLLASQLFLYDGDIWYRGTITQHYSTREVINVCCHMLFRMTFDNKLEFVKDPQGRNFNPDYEVELATMYLEKDNGKFRTA